MACIVCKTRANSLGDGVKAGIWLLHVFLSHIWSSCDFEQTTILSEVLALQKTAVVINDKRIEEELKHASTRLIAYNKA